METLINDTWEHAFPSLLGRKIDMILTDPPYKYETPPMKCGMMRDEGRVSQSQIDDAELNHGVDLAEFLDKCVGLFDTKQHFCGVFTCSLYQIHEYILWARENKLQYNLGVWHKTNPVPLCSCRYLNDVEYWIYIKGNKSKIQGQYATKSLVYTSSINQSDKKKYKHPNCKPVGLMEKFIINHSPTGDGAIFDPFMGSGSTGIACINMHRDFIGIEKDATFFDTAEQRIKHRRDIADEENFSLDDYAR